MATPHWESETLVFDLDDFFARLDADLSTATDEILLESYLFDVDRCGRRVLAALRAAALRGVRIRVIVDGIGSFESIADIAPALDLPLTELRIHHPLPWPLAALARSTDRRPHNPVVRLLDGLNHRDHRKLCVIDAHIAWIGSFNITEGRIPGHPPERHETAARLTGSAVATLREEFFHVWGHRDERVSQRLRRRLGKAFLSNRSHRGRARKNAGMIRRIDDARQRIWICNAYFAPAPALLHALKRAVKRGVLVHVIVPARSDITFFPALTRTFYADLLAAGLTIHEYRDGLLHSKTMLIDEQLIVGSTNLNYRSYFHDLELDAILDHPDSIALAEQHFRADLMQSEPITLRRMEQFPRLVLLFGWLPRLLRYWF